ncbi:pro-resilin-like [Adelges cooleyi]|uniref:pro-resilin-like n=1 Tax=Adelges cooleyi TaxID=133065 RepID=UPI00217FCF6E|nr:pro-resilin-like [Adelges cooleyi]
MYMQKESLAVLVLAAFACAQYGAPSGNPGYGGVGASPSNDYGQKAPGPAGGAGADGNSEPEPFNFAYEVKDAPTYTDFKHQANSDGKRVTGEYSVLLPDGRNQRVTYVADENGYNAQVNYEGEAKPQPSGPAPGAQGRYPAPASGSQGAYPAASGPQPGYASPATQQGGYSAQGSYQAASGVKGYSGSIPSQSSYPAPSPSSYPAPSPSSYPSAQGGYSAPSGYPSPVKASYAAPQGNNGGY